MPEEPTIHAARFEEIDRYALYRILKLRSDVFIIEQDCAYDDVDGLDELPSTTHMWMDDGGEVIAALRVLAGPGYTPHIGRVVTAAAHRRKRHGERLMRAAIELTGTPVEIKAQSRLCDWYAKLGFEPFGEEFDEYGILHQPMRLTRP